MYVYVLKKSVNCVHIHIHIPFTTDDVGVANSTIPVDTLHK